MKRKQTSDSEMIVYGTVKVSDKGQIALPVDLRNDIDIKRGDQLLIVRKKNSRSFTIMTMDEIVSTVAAKWVDDYAVKP